MEDSYLGAHIVEMASYNRLVYVEKRAMYCRSGTTWVGIICTSSRSCRIYCKRCLDSRDGIRVNKIRESPSEIVAGALGVPGSFGTRPELSIANLG